MSHVLHRHCRSEPPVAMRGAGAYLYDAAGKAYLDGSGGAAVSCLGHGDADVIKAIQDQAAALAYAHTGFFTSEPAEALADLLVAHAPAGLSRVYLVSGGSEAMESAIKLARQYFVEIDQPQRRHIIARKQSYHGNTLGALATGGNAWRRAPFAPLLVEFNHVSACHHYRFGNEGEGEFAYGQRLVAELEAQIETLGGENIMAFVAEPVVGATMGAVPSVPGYFKGIRALCDRHGILLILDEVMCGMGRTGTLFACEQDGVVPDIVAVAKGLGGGYQPIGAMLCQGYIFDALRDGSGFFQHGHTYLGHPIAAAAGLAVVTKLTSGGMVGRARQQGVALRSALEAAFGQHPHVGEIRGRGMFQGLEIVADRDGKTSFDPARGVAKAIKAAAFEAGLICYPMGGTTDGISGDHVLLAPPFIITDAQIDELTQKLARAIDGAIAMTA